MTPALSFLPNSVVDGKWALLSAYDIVVVQKVSLGVYWSRKVVGIVLDLVGLGVRSDTKVNTMEAAAIKEFMI